MTPRIYTETHFAGCGEVPANVRNRTMVVLGEGDHRVTLSDATVHGVADLIARAFEALATADLTPDERLAVRTRMAEALHSVQPIDYLPVPPPPSVENITDARCCAHLAPGPTGTRQEGARWTCSTCGRAYAWVIEESEGAWWARVGDAGITGSGRAEVGA